MAIEKRAILRESRSHMAPWRAIRLFVLMLGPGVLAMIGDNDAGGIISYAVTGAQFGVGLFIPLVLVLGFVTYTVQEMSLRVGAVSQTGYARLVFDRFGRFWGYYHLTTLTFENLITLVTEFIGMTAGLVLLGIPFAVADMASFLLVASVTVFSGYLTKERLALIISGLNVVFVVVALLTHPDYAAIGHALLHWNLPTSVGFGAVVFYIIATIGNAVAPWMIFFQGSAAIDKGVNEQKLRTGRIDTFVGAVLQVVIAAFIILCGAALFGKLTDLSAVGPVSLIAAMNSHYGHLAAILFGFGLFNAGFLASITISLSSSWTIAESFGWARSLNDSVRQAPGFYAVYFGSLAIAAGVLLLPGLPLDLIAVLAQVIGGILIAPILIFLVLFASDRKLLGRHASRLWSRIWSWAIVSLLIVLTIVTVWQAIVGL